MSDIGWAGARHRAYDAATALPTGTVALDDALGTTLADPLVARVPLPPFDTAAMDGYAVCGPPPWRVVGVVLAGAPPPPPLQPGTAVEIATGACVPSTADAVVPHEAAVAGPDGVTGAVSGAVSAGGHVRRRGEECAVGTLLLPAGTAVTPAVLGLAAAAGYDDLVVRRRPRVAALVTGDELARHGLPGPGRIRDAVGPQLRGLVAWVGGELVGLSHVADSRRALEHALAGEVEPPPGADAVAPADVVVTTGASSVGRADHLRAVLAGLGADVLVDGVACRPGHPQVLARLPTGACVVGLPGNPLAALAGVVTLLAPLVAGLTSRGLPALEPARLVAPVEAHPAATRLIPVRPLGDRFLPVGHAGAAMLRGVAAATAMAVLAPGSGATAAVEVVRLPVG